MPDAVLMGEPFGRRCKQRAGEGRPSRLGAWMSRERGRAPIYLSTCLREALRLGWELLGDMPQPSPT